MPRVKSQIISSIAGKWINDHIPINNWFYQSMELLVISHMTVGSLSRLICRFFFSQRKLPRRCWRSTLLSFWSHMMTIIDRSYRAHHCYKNNTFGNRRRRRPRANLTNNTTYVIIPLFLLFSLTTEISLVTGAENPNRRPRKCMFRSGTLHFDAFDRAHLAIASLYPLPPFFPQLCFFFATFSYQYLSPQRTFTSSLSLTSLSLSSSPKTGRSER